METAYEALGPLSRNDDQRGSKGNGSEALGPLDRWKTVRVALDPVERVGGSTTGRLVGRWPFGRDAWNVWKEAGE